MTCLNPVSFNSSQNIGGNEYYRGTKLERPKIEIGRHFVVFRHQSDTWSGISARNIEPNSVRTQCYKARILNLIYPIGYSVFGVVCHCQSERLEL